MNALPMIRSLTTLCSASVLVAAWPGTAQAQDIAASATTPAIGTEAWASTDSDGTEVLKVLSRVLWNFETNEKFAGIAVERAWFSPSAGEHVESERVYLDLAHELGSRWRWRARVGTDGHTILGSAELRASDWSQSLFVEREIIETRLGLDQKLYFTFFGASTDIAIDDANTITLTAGVQEFSGENERLHLRGRYIHAVEADWGLSVQLDARYYHSTEPHEFDYFSPRDFVRILPLAQVRRFDETGWMLLAAGGLGGQYSTNSGWSKSRLAQLRIESPRAAGNLNAFTEVLYTNDSLTGGADYDYLMARLGLTVGF